MDYYERLDVERIKQKYEMCLKLKHAADDAGEWWRLDHEGRSHDTRETSDDSLRRIDLFGTLELWGDFVSGYISSIDDESYLKELDEHWIARAKESVKGLRRGDIFHNADIREWHTQNIERYPHIKAYIELVDYMRLMGINYIETYVFPRYKISLSLE